MSNTPAFDSPFGAALHRKIVDRTAQIGVIGMGYVGLPLAVEFARSGFDVVGIDVDAQRCAAINRGESHIPDVPGEVTAELTGAGKLRAVPDVSEAGHLDVVVICVPTPLRKTRDPDLSHIVYATQSLQEHLRPGTLVILESTTYPGTTEEVIRVALEETGLKAGVDFFLAFSPERVDPGNATWNTKNVPKVVGGLTPDCSQLTESLYGAAVDRVVTVSSPRTAEMVKLLENTFRAINIGLVNELALMCERIGISIWEVIDAAATKPFGFMPFFPGPGLGGHCIPIDPFYLAWKVRQVGLEARFIDLAGQVNAAMPHHVVDIISDALNSHSKSINGSDILLMGVSYKPQVNDVRESPALDVIALLSKKGAHVTYHDPFVPRLDAQSHSPAGELTRNSVPYTLDTIAAADCVVILTDHRGFDYDELARTAKLVVDARNAVSMPAANVFRLGAPNPGLLVEESRHQ